MINEPFAFCITGVEDPIHEGEVLSASAIEGIRTPFRAAGFPDDDVDLEVSSVGYGADALVVLAALGGLATLFMSGKKIEENIDAWVRLGARFRKLFRGLNARPGHTAFSMPVALALAIDHILSEDVDVEGLTILGSHIIPVANGSLRCEDWPLFKRQPDRFYVFILGTNNYDSFVVGLKSDGDFLFVHRVATGDYAEFFGLLDSTDS